jgi:hypothetical protein
MKYILDGHTPVPCEDIHEWVRWFEAADRHVANDYLVDNQARQIHISTVFLGMDHAWGVGPPLLFETMIFGGEEDQYQERFHTWDEAASRHVVLVDLISRGQPIEED